MRMVLLLALVASAAFGEYHLTARPWKPAAFSRDRLLGYIEGVVRFSMKHQNAEGAIIDPYLHREHQYATPYFAYAAGTLAAERPAAKDVLAAGVRAMDHATRCFAGGRTAIPDEHGEFFIAVLTGALDIYKPLIPRDTYEQWRERMRKPVAEVLGGGKNNWETYAMKGEWMRALAGLADRAAAVKLIEDAWTGNHKGRMSVDALRLYHDRSSTPDTLNVEAVGRGNLLALMHLGYNGPSAAEIRTAVETGTRTALRLQDPSGQAPTNGRTDDHVWVDVGYGLGFEVMAEDTRDPWEAGQFRHAAMKAFENIARWQRPDGAFFVTKNWFDPTLRVGHQTASQWSNYNGSLMFHLAEAFHLWHREIEEKPSPAEIGGYAVVTDDTFGSVIANAGGMLVQWNHRGQVAESSGNYWTPLGTVRFARTGWDARLGPSDGALTAKGGITFGPTFQEGDGKWLRLADLSGKYTGSTSVEFAHPMLVIANITWTGSGPTFRERLTITPDGVLSTVQRSGAPARQPWGVVWPLLADDGASKLTVQVRDGIASTTYGKGDTQNFIALDEGARTTEDATLRSTYGDLRAMRVTNEREELRTFVYPQSPGDPAAEAVRRSWKATPNGFVSALGRLDGKVYVGRTAAGGIAQSLDLDGDGRPELRFDRECGFLVQLRGKTMTAIEADRDVAATLGGRTVRLKAWSPLTLTR